jgi:hypothetical protein
MMRVSGAGPTEIIQTQGRLVDEIKFNLDNYSTSFGVHHPERSLSHQEFAGGVRGVLRLNLRSLIPEFNIEPVSLLVRSLGAPEVRVLT